MVLLYWYRTGGARGDSGHALRGALQDLHPTPNSRHAAVSFGMSARMRHAGHRCNRCNRCGVRGHMAAVVNTLFDFNLVMMKILLDLRNGQADEGGVSLKRRRPRQRTRSWLWGHKHKSAHSRTLELATIQFRKAGPQPDQKKAFTLREGAPLRSKPTNPEATTWRPPEAAISMHRAGVRLHHRCEPTLLSKRSKKLTRSTPVSPPSTAASACLSAAPCVRA